MPTVTYLGSSALIKIEDMDRVGQLGLRLICHTALADGARPISKTLLITLHSEFYPVNRINALLFCASFVVSP